MRRIHQQVVDRNVDSEFCGSRHSSLPSDNEVHAPCHWDLRTYPSRKCLRKDEIEKSAGRFERAIPTFGCQRNSICQLDGTLSKFATRNCDSDTVAARGSAGSNARFSQQNSDQTWNALGKPA